MTDERSSTGRAPADRKPQPNRTVSGEQQQPDRQVDHALRPQSLTEMIGQDRLRDKMQILVEAARGRGDALDHVLLYGPPGLGKCITSDSWILTAEGLTQFTNLLPSLLADDAYATSSHVVYGIDGLEPVSHVYANGIGPTLKLTTRSGFTIEGTPNHPLLVATADGPTWKSLGELLPDDFVAIARGTEIWGTAQTVRWQPSSAADRRRHSEARVVDAHTRISAAIGRPPTAMELRYVYAGRQDGNPTAQLTAQRLQLPLSDGRRVASVALPWELAAAPCGPAEQTVTIDEDIAYLLGVLVGDGHFERGRNAPRFVITSSEPEMQAELQRISIRHFGNAPQVKQYGTKAAQLRFSQSIGAVMLAFGALAVHAAEKVVPSAVLQGPRAVQIGFLQGLFDADGSAWPDGYVEFGTRSDVLAQQVQLLLANLGIIASRNEKQRTGASFWYLFMGGLDAVRFHHTVGFRLARKAARILSLLPDWVKGEPEYATLDALCAPGIYWDRVAALQAGRAATFDFVVPGTHSFVANGFYNHNTTLSHILAHEMGANLKVTAGPAVEKAGDLAAILTNLRKGDILFIDEIHRLGRAVEEILYPAMEDFSLNIVVGSGPGARNIQLSLPKFTVVGATTRLALMTSPLRARFGVVERFDFYDQPAVQEIVLRAARLLKVPLDVAGAQAIARRARGTPRVALRLLRRLRDYAQVRSDGRITLPVAEDALALLEIDELGLDDLDRRVLDALINKFSGGPVGLDTLAASISEEPDTIMDVVEPYLLQLGFLDRTPRGRVPTRAAYAHLQVPYPERPEQSGLFG